MILCRAANQEYTEFSKSPTGFFINDITMPGGFLPDAVRDVRNCLVTTGPTIETRESRNLRLENASGPNEVSVEEFLDFNFKEQPK